MKHYIFSHKDIQGGVPVILEGIKKELGEMIKHLDCDSEQVDAQISLLKQQLTQLTLLQRKNESDDSLKKNILEIKTKIRSLDIVIGLKQKIEELTNYPNQSENLNLQIEVYECILMEEQKNSLSSVGRLSIENIKYAYGIHDQDQNKMNQQNKEMPECFEKSLIRICYLLEILKNQLGPDSQIELKTKEEILKVNSKDEVLNHIDSDMTLLLKYYEQSKIDDNSVEIQMKETIKVFKEAKNDQKIVDQSQINFNNLLSKVRPFNFQEFFQLVKICDKNSEEVRDKDIILLLGTTGAGKSTTIQYLFGGNMMKINDHIQAYPMNAKLKSFVASSAMKSETRYINCIDFEYTNTQRKKMTIFIVDTPGFGDTQSVEVDIANSLAIIRAVGKAKSVRPVFLFNQKNTGQRWELMKQLLTFYSCMIKNLEANIDSINFFFTHFANLNQDMGMLMENVNKELNALELSQPSLVQILERMEILGKENKLLILNPLDKEKRIKVLEQILSTKPIINPKKAFTLNILERSRSYLEKQISFHEKSILEAVSQDRTENASYNIQEIKELSEIFEPYDSFYQNRLQHIKNAIKILLNQKFDPVKERICICMKPGNQLYENDIKKLKDALDSEKKLRPLISSTLIQIEQESSQMQFDEQSTMITEIISQCQNILNQIDREKKVCDDEWFHYIKKAIDLSENFVEFKHTVKNALDKFNLKFYSMCISAKKILKNLSIEDYQLKEIDGESSCDEVKSKHQQFGELLYFLTSGLKKIRFITIGDISQFTQNLEKFIQELLKKVPKVTNKIAQYFEFQKDEDGFDYKVITQQKLKNIMKALEMIEKYMNACKNIDNRFYVEFEKIFLDCIKKCEELFENHKKYFDELEKNLDTKKSAEVNSRFKQIDLLRQIPQMMQKSNGPYYSIISQLKNSVSFSKGEILSIIEELNYLTEQQEGNIQGLNLIFKRLKEALISIKTLGEATTENQEFMKRMYLKIEESFKSLVKRLEQEANQYLNLTAKTYSNIRPLANIYEQIIKIEELSTIIKAQIQTEIKNDFIQQIKNVLLKIQQDCQEFQIKVKEKADYKSLDNYYKFINEFLVQNSSAIGLVRKHVNLSFQDEKEQKLIIDQNILEIIYKSIIKQQELKKTEFNLEFDKFLKLTQVNDVKDSQEEQKALNQQETQNDQKNVETIQSQAGKIHKFFKLEYDLKNYYEQAYFQSSYEDKGTDDDYLLKIFTDQVYSKFLEELSRQATLDLQPIEWKYIKLQGLKYLQDIDPYIYGSKDRSIKQIYDTLYDQVHFNPPQYIKKAQEHFDKGDFEGINEMCRNLKALPPTENKNSQNILNKIKNFLSDQAFKKYQQITYQIPYDNDLQIDQAREIAKLSLVLIKWKNELDEYIQISSKSISDQIQNLLKLLKECFQHLVDEVDKNVKQNKFSISLGLIKKSADLTSIFKSVFDNGDTSESFKTILETNNQIQKQKTEIPDLISSKFDYFLKIKDTIFDFNSSPKQYCDNIEQIKNNDSIEQKLQNFIFQLNEKYKNIKNEIIKEIETAQNTHKIFEIEHKILKYSESTQYLPTAISSNIKAQFQGILDNNLSDFKKRQEKENEEFGIKFNQKLQSLDLSNFLEEKQNLILNDKTGSLKILVTEKIQELIDNKLQLGKKNIDDYEFVQAIKFQIQELSRFVNHPQLKTYLDAQQVQNFYELTSKIAKLFQSSFQLCSKYFSETHSEIGEAIIQEQFIDNQQTRDQNLKILKAVFAVLIENKELILQFLFPQLELYLINFLTESLMYLRKMKSQYQDSLQKKIIDQNIAVINNMKFTNLISNELIRIIDSIKEVICNKNCNEFLQEVNNVTLNYMQNQTMNWLQRDSTALKNQSFLDINRSEQDNLKFYREIQNFYDTITKARVTEEKSLIRENDQTKIQIICADFYQYCKEEINLVSEKVQNLNKIINEDGQLEKADQENFGTLYRSLNSMGQTLKIEKSIIEKAINGIEGALRTKLNRLSNEAKECYIHGETKLQLGQLAKILCEIQTINENLVFFQEKINNTINYILEDYSKSRPKASTAAVELQSNLRSNLPGIGSQGPMLAQNHPFFRGVNILEANKKFQSKKIDDVLKTIEGTELNDEEKQELKKFYEEFLGIYATILDENLTISTSQNQNKQQEIQFSGIVSTIKNVCSNDSRQKWSEDEIFQEIEWGINRQMKKKICLLLANIFALWSLMNADDYKKQQEQDASQPNLKGYLLQPHVAQILSILRIMGVGYTEQYKEGSKFNNNWGKYFGNGKSDISWVRNNFVQIKTGEGKSIVLAVVSIIFALNGFNVDCACYSKYLSIRDKESFMPLFRALGLQNNIYYGTFNEIAERKLNQDGNIRDIIQCLVLKKEYCQNKNVINLNQDIRPQVLLIDEVDVFFSKSFYGNSYIPQALIKHNNITCLTDWIWKENQQMKDIKNKLKPDDPIQSKSSYISLRKLKKTTEYKNALNLFKPEYQFMLEEACKKMIIDVVEYESTNHHYVVYQGKIGYENQDEIATNVRIGYQTLFAYYYRHQCGEIQNQEFESRKAIGINCSYFSYAEVPHQYNIILGVTGTLQTLSEPQKNIINNVYKINHQTLSPSVYSNNDTVFNPVQNVYIVKDSSEYYRKLINEMEIYQDSGRPIILFFEDNKSLKNFKESESFTDKKYSYQILSEIDSDQEKKIKVLRATQAGVVTLSTKNFGRGTDFCCYDQKVIEAGGLIVIQTFLSEDISEETQIRGRTGRQGTKGIYLLFLNLADLSKFNIEPTHIEYSPQYYQTLCQFRDAKLSDEQNATTQNRDQLKKDHDLSILMMKIIIRKILNDSNIQMIDAEKQSSEEEKSIPKEGQKSGDLQQIDQEQMINHLLELNKGITLETDEKFMKVLVLIDATGSMSLTLQKTKNCVRDMFKEARKALQEMDVSEQLILMKIGAYRNYNSPLNEIFQVSPQWSNDPNTIAKFLQSLETKGGYGNEAMEIGLQYANKEIQNDKNIPLSMIIIIGDAPPNTLQEVEAKRKEKVGWLIDRNYWEKSDYKVQTYWEDELKKIEQAKVPVHSFYLLNKNLKGIEAESSKASLKKEFEKLAVNEGKCAFIDIHNHAGQKKIQEFLTYLIVYRTTEINKGQEKAIQSVSKMEVAFT